MHQAYLNNNRFLNEEYNSYKCKLTNSEDDVNPKNLRKGMHLDSQSTIDIFCNSDYLERVKEVKKWKQWCKKTRVFKELWMGMVQ